jgi:surfactin synthase thioesterase subunit
MNSVNLFCLPFAGGSKYSYRELEESAPPFLRVIPLEYPGRGTRLREPLLKDVNALLEDIYGQIKDELNKNSYAVYGHSMGGLLACLLVRKIIQNDHPPPLHLFITGTMGPSAVERKEKKRHLLDKPDFIEELKRLDGSPDEILGNDELLDYFEPIIRADFQATETYEYEEAPPLNIPMTVITGTEEEMEPADIGLWQKETSIKVDFRRMRGKHFFIFKHPGVIVEIISKKLLTN